MPLKSAIVALNPALSGARNLARRSACRMASGLAPGPAGGLAFGLTFGLALGFTLALAFGLAAVPCANGQNPGATTASSAVGDSARELGREISRLVDEGRWEQALPLCRRYVQDFPGDPRMLYNLACLENRAGRSRQAVAALQQALAAGFDEMGYALQDEDLKGVADHPDLWTLDGQAAARLARTADRKAFALELGVWSPAVTLEPAGGDQAAAKPSLRLCWQPTGLDLELTAPGVWAGMASGGSDSGDSASEDLAPWQGGPGAVVILSVPDGTGPFAAENDFVFAFGTRQGQVVGAMYLPGPRSWQQIAEMNPKLRRDQGGPDTPNTPDTAGAPAGAVVLTGTIPWQSIMPYHPLVDPALGVNVVVRRDRTAGYAKAALLPDPWAFAPQSPRHRFVPLNFRIETLGIDLFMGKVSDSLSRQEPLTVALTAVSAAPGTGQLTLDVVDGEGHSLSPEGPRAEPVLLPAGPHTMPRPVDFRGLPTGAYLVKADLILPSGKRAAWSTTVLHLAAGWEEGFRSRIDGLRPAERRTAHGHLQALAGAVATHRTRRNPGPLANTLEDLQGMLAHADRSGSILPDRGAADFVYPGPGDSARRCSLYLAAHPDSAAPFLPVLVLTAARGREAQIVARIARNYDFSPPDSTGTGGAGGLRLVYIVPHLDPGAATLDQAAAEALACLDWALSYFGAPRAAVVGVDAEGGTALVLAASQPARLRALQVFAGQDLDPWPQAQNSFVRARLSPAPAGLPVTWIDFVQESAVAGRGPAILSAMRELGWSFAEVQQVRGGLSLSQAADRLVLWARVLGESPGDRP